MIEKVLWSDSQPIWLKSLFLRTSSWGANFENDWERSFLNPISNWSLAAEPSWTWTCNDIRAACFFLLPHVGEQCSVSTPEITNHLLSKPACASPKLCPAHTGIPKRDEITRKIPPARPHHDQLHVSFLGCFWRQPWTLSGLDGKIRTWRNEFEEVFLQPLALVRFPNLLLYSNIYVSRAVTLGVT